MFEEFASGYYIRPYWVVEESGKGRINEREYEYVREHVYNDQEPIVMKLGTAHFEVQGDDSVPAQTIHVDPAFTEDIDMDRSPGKAPVLLAKPSIADHILSFSQQFRGEGFDVISSG